MKKTISINIAGLIFYIEEDGFNKLKTYLNSIQKYFANYEDSKEILSDIEGRIAEKFLNKQKTDDKQAIALEDVEELIKSMGTVSDFEAIEEAEDLVEGAPAQPKATSVADSEEAQAASGYKYEYQFDPKTGKRQTSYSYNGRKLQRDTKRKLLGGVCAGVAHYFNTDPLLVRLLFLFFFIGFPISGGIIGEEFFGSLSGIIFLLYIACWVAFPGSNTIEEDKSIKKLYRDPDKKVVGGVAAGVAAYFGVDTGMVRFIWVLSVLLFGTGLLLYLVLWVITPKANTLTEKMEMAGQPITLENIETNVKKSLQPDGQKEESALTKILLFPFRLVAMIFTGLSPFAKFLTVIIRIFAGLMLLLIGGSALIGLTTALFAAFGLGSWDFGQIDNDLMPLNFFLGEVSSVTYFFFFLAIGVPFAMIAWAGVSLLSSENKFTPAIWQTMLGLFLAGLLGSSIMGLKYGSYFRKEGSVEKVQTYALPQNLILDVNNDSEDGYNNTHLELEGYEANEAKLEMKFSSQGRSRQEAESNAADMVYNVAQKDSALVFDEDFSLAEKKTRFRGQRLRLTFYMPYDKTFRMTRDFYDEFWGVRHKAQKEYNLDINSETFKNVRWVMKKDSGLVCLDRPVVIESDNDDDHTGNEYSDTDEIENGIESGISEAFDESFETRGEMVKQYDVTSFQKVSVSGAFVVRIQKGDAFKVAADGREKDIDKITVQVKEGRLIVEQNNKLKIFGDNKRTGLTITMPTVENIDLAGATLTKVQGFNNLTKLDMDIAGASKATLDIKTQQLSLNVSGASKIDLQGSANTLEADLAGACVLDAEQMTIQNADVSASGASRARLGNIPNLRSNTSGMSSIKKRD